MNLLGTFALLSLARDNTKICEAPVSQILLGKPQYWGTWVWGEERTEAAHVPSCCCGLWASWRRIPEIFRLVLAQSSCAMVLCWAVGQSGFGVVILERLTLAFEYLPLLVQSCFKLLLLIWLFPGRRWHLPPMCSPLLYSYFMFQAETLLLHSVRGHHVANIPFLTLLKPDINEISIANIY